MIRLQKPTATSDEIDIILVTTLRLEVAPWFIETPVDIEDSELCNVCRHISFDTLLHTIDTYMYESLIPLGGLQNIAGKVGCSFCRLVAHTSSHVLEQSMESLGTHGSNVYCELCGDTSWNRYLTRIRFVCLKLTITLPRENGGLLIKYGWIQQLLNSIDRPPEQARNDSRPIKDQIDVELIKSWLEVCKEQHNSTYLEDRTFYASFASDTPTDLYSSSTAITQPCRPTLLNSVGSDLTLIDVKRECLVNMPMNTTHVALSYVWGGPQPFQNVKSRRESLCIPHSISVDDEVIPQTIRDAIRLVDNLGEKYIWVDSLCICQDDTANKLRQIRNMGTIYSQAFLTIVAASGNNAHAGLPGVQESSRSSVQRIENVQGLVLANELPRLKDIMEKSYWNSRGWTYQEKELCKRYLIFCKTHVFFQCNRTSYKEDSGLGEVTITGSRTKRIRGERHPV